ncbi:MAG: hypothetical protein CMQ44_04705 [Gammaproteobacteria bacterium]|nr:hypothetical protein [Gammaproteobacteria bacterium]
MGTQVFSIDHSLASDTVRHLIVDRPLCMFGEKGRVANEFCYRHRHFDGITYSLDEIHIANGQITVGSGYEWRSWLNVFQGPLVFLGVWPVGLPHPQYKYGRPWTLDASMVLSVLLRHDVDGALSNSQIVDIYRDLLNITRVPLRGFFIAGARVRLLFH